MSDLPEKDAGAADHAAQGQGCAGGESGSSAIPGRQPGALAAGAPSPGRLVDADALIAHLEFSSTDMIFTKGLGDYHSKVVAKIAAFPPAAPFDQQNKAETAEASGAARQPSITPATPEGDALRLNAEGYALVARHVADGLSELPEGDAISRGAAIAAAETFNGPASDSQFCMGQSTAAQQIVAALRSLPPQDGEREQIERLTAQLDAMTNRAEVSEYKRRIAVEEVQPMIIARAEKAEARVVALEAELPKQYEMGRLAGSMVSALTAQPVAQFLATEDGEFNGNALETVSGGRILSFEPGFLRVNLDGSGYFCVPDAEMVFEDDRQEGPDGPEGTVHWIAKMDASEIVALRDFLNLAQPVEQEPLAGTPITMTYRNYRGEIDRRTVVPTRIWFGSTDWHPEPGWLMSAYDLAKAAHRDFALADCQFADLAHPATPAPVEAGLRDWFSDCRVLMANLDAMISHTGEAPEDEDGFMVDEIREAIALRAQSSPVVPVTPPPASDNGEGGEG